VKFFWGGSGAGFGAPRPAGPGFARRFFEEGGAGVYPAGRTPGQLLAGLGGAPRGPEAFAGPGHIKTPLKAAGGAHRPFPCAPPGLTPCQDPWETRRPSSDNFLATGPAARVAKDATWSQKKAKKGPGWGFPALHAFFAAAHDPPRTCPAHNTAKQAPRKQKKPAPGLKGKRKQPASSSSAAKAPAKRAKKSGKDEKKAEPERKEDEDGSEDADDSDVPPYWKLKVSTKTLTPAYLT
jgi:hypothetical protein